MTWNPLFDGLVAVAGVTDVGKTSFLLSAQDVNGNTCPPDEMFVVDDDVKTGSMVRSWLPQDRYINMVKATSGMKELDLYRWALDLVQNRIPKNTRLLVWDPWSRMNIAFHAAVAADPGKFRSEYAPMGQIKAGQMWQEADRLEGWFISEMLQVVPMVGISSHMKQDRLKTSQGSVPIPDRMIPNFRTAVLQKSRMRVQLLHNTQPQSKQYPIGLMVKRLSDMRMLDNKLTTVEITPRKMPVFNWDEILKFWNEPAQFRTNLGNEFVPTKAETSSMEGTLSMDQVLAWTNLAKLAQSDDESELPAGSTPSTVDAKITNEQAAQIATAKAAGKNQFQIVAETGLPLAVVQAALMGGS